MKKILFFALILLAVASCKKNNDSSDPADPSTDSREAFVGEYELYLSGTATISTNNETVNGMLPDSIDIKKMFGDPVTLNIEKDPTSDNQVVISSKLYNCKALVSGNNLVLESSTETKNVEVGEVADLGIDIGTIPVSYTFVHKTATLNDGVLTWHTDANLSTSFSFYVLTVDMTADADIENTATKK